VIIKLDGIRWKRHEIGSPGKVVWKAKGDIVAPPEIHQKLDRLAYQIEHEGSLVGRPSDALTVIAWLKARTPPGEKPSSKLKSEAETEFGLVRRTINKYIQKHW
jgi:hypothetical protein